MTCRGYGDQIFFAVGGHHDSLWSKGRAIEGHIEATYCLRLPYLITVTACDCHREAICGLNPLNFVISKCNNI